jgi:hypothetical protein
MQNYGLRKDVHKNLVLMNLAFNRLFNRDMPITEGYRSDENQAILYKNAVAKYGPAEAPKWVAPPGISRHRLGTEIDFQTSTMTDEEKYWLARNAQNFGFQNRYSWEPWHYGMDVPNAQPIKQMANVTSPTPPITPPVMEQPLEETPLSNIVPLMNPFKSLMPMPDTEPSSPGQLPSPTPVAKYPVPYNTDPNEILQDALRGMV